MQARLDDLPKITSKGYPSAMHEFVKKKIDNFKWEVEEGQKEYAKQVVLPEEKRTTHIADVEKSTAEITAATKKS